jgi:predicted GIY-YIG superfamily endonuclease
MTWDPSIRSEQHLSKFGSRYTREHGVRKLAYLERVDDFDAARSREKQIKGWSQNKKKKLINGEWKSEWR